MHVEQPVFRAGAVISKVLTLGCSLDICRRCSSSYAYIQLSRRYLIHPHNGVP